jgi:hypothetical protein
LFIELTNQLKEVSWLSIIGKQTKSRGSWGGIKPITRVKESKKVYNRKKAKAKKEW